MLLETKNIKENDIIIYSRNSTDEDYNFRIVFKNDPQKHNRIISFNHIRKLITEYFPKNLVAYRILSNFPDVSINAKYGCIILIDSKPELIFTDPVFAVKTIEEYLEYKPNVEFRFRIQKVGFTTVNEFKTKANFKEEFVYDLNIDEAINQNDEVFIKSLIEKRTAPKKRKRSRGEIKRNIIFKPEGKDIVDYLESDEEQGNKQNDLETEKLRERAERLSQGEIEYRGKNLNTEKVERFRDEKKQIELSFPNDRRIEVKDFQIETTSRSDQQNNRIETRDSGISSNEGMNDLRLNISETKESIKSDFKKIQSLPPISVRKVHINEDGSQTKIEPETPVKQSDNLFSNFLINLQNESVSKAKKKNRHKESDIIQMFKSLQKSKSENEQNKSVVFKSSKKN
jgi:hypothetical protein